MGLPSGTVTFLFTDSACASEATSGRNARATDCQSPAHGKWAPPSSGMSVARGIPAASSRPSWYGIARSPRRCTTSVGARTRSNSARTSLR